MTDVQTLRAEEHSRRRETLAGWDVNITTYRIGTTYHCHVDNVSPGATVARGEGRTKAEAEKVALEKARERLVKTRRMDRVD